MPYTRLAPIYDALHAGRGKDYEREAGIVHQFIQRYKRSPGNTLLDIACGTGRHLRFLQQQYQVAGLDSCAEMIALARQHVPSIPIYYADMEQLDLDRSFDCIISLFSTIGHVQTVARLQQTIRGWERHLRPGGVMIVEPWFTPQTFRADEVGTIFVEQPDIKVAHMYWNSVTGTHVAVHSHFLVATAAGVDHFTGRQDFGLFTHEQYCAAFTGADLTPDYIEEGLTGRGLYIGVKPE